MPIVRQDGDLNWLIKQIPPNDVLEFRNTKVPALIKIIRDSDHESLPKTIGIFGSWGSGKTSLLAMLADELMRIEHRNSYFPVIYFNAWKYAGFMEMVPALIYKVLKFVTPPDDPSRWEMVYKVMQSLGKKYADQFGDWAQKRFGINVSELSQDIIQAKKEWTADQERREFLDAYYTQVDKAQDTLNSVFEGMVNPAVVLVDELDRCDPGEAFEAIKKLRVFFSMRGIPIIFLLSVNPDPIGAAIRHQYGLESEISEYETRRILEKFVDTHLDMAESISLGPLVHQIIDLNSNANVVGVVQRMDRNGCGHGKKVSSLYDVELFDAFRSDNRLYSNLRILRKSWEFVVGKSSGDGHLWTKWHLDVLKQGHLSIRKKVKKVADELANISFYSHYHLLNDFFNQGVLIEEPNPVVDFSKLISNKGNTAFSIYRSWFWEMTRKSIDRLIQENTDQGRESAGVLRDFSADYHLMDFLSSMCLIDFRLDKQTMGNNLYSPGVISPGTHKLHPDFHHLAWALANY